MRTMRVSIFIFLVAALTLAGGAPQRIFAERRAMHARTGARSARLPAGQQNGRRRRPAPQPQQQQALTPLLTADNPTPTFPKQIAGTTSAPVIVTITNSSTTVTVTISSITSDNADFITAGCLSALAPNATCQLSVTFKPNAQAVCSDAANISIVSNDPASPLALTATSFAATPGGLVTDDLRDQALTASDLAQALVGSGVSISSVTYTGAPIAAGTFKGGSSIIGFDSGIILSNGAVSNVIGPNCDTGITWVNNTPGDADLTAIIGQQTNDAAVLEFDFNPSSPTIRFQYVFASDEYQEFVFDFNDVFAFFVNGQNVALVPQTNTIVSINNVNNGSTDSANLGIPPVNPSFYLNNDVPPSTAAPFNTEMDGMTVVLTATAKVNPGVTNHIKLAIADALDFVLDSNVFIKGGSLSSTVVSLSPTGIAFGNENVGSTSAAQTVTLTNVGTAALTGVSVATSSSVFTQTNTCAADVAPGGNCTISVKFAPTAAGPVQGSLSITDSAGDSPQPVSLSGTGISGAFASLSPLSLAFGPQATGTTSPAKNVTVTNTGTTALTFSSITATSFTAAGTDFAETDNCVDFTIQPTSSCTISVTWTPGAGVTLETGALTLVDNAQNNGTQTVGLTGGVTNTITVSPASLPFGNQSVNSTSAAQTITVSNTGTAVVLIPSIVVPPGFAETDNCVSSGGLNPAGGTSPTSCTINVTFTPTSATGFTGNLTITDSAQGSPHTVMLSGTGTSAAPTLVSIAVTPTTATVAVNGTQQFTATGTFSDNSTKDVTTQSTWTSSGPATASVGAATGLATGVAAGGPVTITATDGTIKGTAQLTVSNGPTLKSIAVTPTTATIAVNGTQQFTATGTFSDNSTKDVTTQSAWKSSNTEVATVVAGTGLATGVGVGGPVTITATDAGISGSASLTVSNSPVTLTINPPPGGVFGPVAPGGTLPVGVVLTAIPGTTGTVTFSCTTSSPTITCLPQPQSVALSPNGPLQVAIVVNTFCRGTTTGYVVPTGGSGGGLALLLLSAILAGATWIFRRNPRWALSFALFLLIALGGVACNSLPRNPNGATQPGNYQLFITATFNGQTVAAPEVNFVVN
jgi:hypothetical protein